MFLVRKEARKVGSTYVVDQLHGQPPRIATSPEVFQALEKGRVFPEGASQLDIIHGLQARNPKKPLGSR